MAAAGAAPAGHGSDGSWAPARALGLLPGRRWRSAAGASVGVEMPCRIAADCGGAITGAGRIDLYLGAGDDALATAGRVHARVRVFRIAADGPRQP